MLTTQAVGIDLGTTYSCIAYLNEHGEPITLLNREGELSTPSVVLFEEDRVIVGTEALHNAIRQPDRVVQNSKRYMGEADRRWVVDGKSYSPIDIASFLLKKMISDAQEKIGPIEQAVITVPAQFSDFQRHATIQAGHNAGLKHVDIINEPVAAALCYVLGSEGMWFSELADEQRILVFDLGGGTFGLSLVKYQKNEVSVIASSGDLNLGGIDWNRALVKKICRQFAKQFERDPRNSNETLQTLSLEVEQTKRSLSVQPRAPLTCRHSGHSKTYQIELHHFEKLTKPFVERTTDITKKLLKENGMGWAHVDVVLMTGGASRMPMIRTAMKKMSGRTLNTSLSPELSIAHGATYYAGMLVSNDKFARSVLNPEARTRLANVKQQSVNARGLGIFVRDRDTDKKIPHYLIPANTTLPASATQLCGTVIPNQKRVHLQIVESGTSPEESPIVLGNCVIEDLPENLPEDSIIQVTINYDEQARVHVSAKDMTGGKQATAEIIRQENLVPQLTSDQMDNSEVTIIPPKSIIQTKTPAKAAKSPKKSAKSAVSNPSQTLAPKQAPQKKVAKPKSKQNESTRKKEIDAGEDEFWKLAD